jgi:hypothetical protein
MKRDNSIKIEPTPPANIIEDVVAKTKNAVVFGRYPM